MCCNNSIKLARYSTFIRLPRSRFSTQNPTLSSHHQHHSRRRVVCTGIGIVCPLGVGAQHSWQRLINGDIAVTRHNTTGFEDIPSKVCAPVPLGNKQGEFDASTVVTRGEEKYLTKSMMFAIAAADEALNMAQWEAHTDEDQNRTGVAIGCGMVDLDTIADTSHTFRERGYRRVSPFFIPKILTNMAAGHISIRHGFRGPNHSVSTACTTGSHAIGDSMRFIRNGDADVMVCGGSEAAITAVAMSGFARARALSTSFTDACPESSSRPFDADRDGFVMGEGAGVLVLEEYEHARKRNATIYAEVLGYGLSGDAYHMTAMHEEGIGGQLCMCAALRDALVDPQHVAYVNAHATSTPIGDRIENKAIKTLFGEHAYRLKVSSCKGAIGHLLGAAGAVESAFTVLSLHHRVVPPTMNVFKLDDEFDLDYVANVAQTFESFGDGERRVALKNSFGFGGTNASLCFGEYVDH